MIHFSHQPSNAEPTREEKNKIEEYRKQGNYRDALDYIRRLIESKYPMNRWLDDKRHELEREDPNGPR